MRHSLLKRKLRDRYRRHHRLPDGAQPVAAGDARRDDPSGQKAHEKAVDDQKSHEDRQARQDRQYRRKKERQAEKSETRKAASGG